MRYEMLGTLRVVDNESCRTAAGKKFETVLATLLIRSPEIVTSEQLTMEIWGARPPGRASAGLHVYISRLRKFLVSQDQPVSPVGTKPSGYTLRVGDDEVDFAEFLQLVEQGRRYVREGRFTAATSCLDKALSLWRGPVLGGHGRGPITSGFITRMDETRLEGLELMTNAQLGLGLHRELVGRLYSLTSEHPLCEAFHRQLMIALYRSERQADALKAYHVARTTLREELGVEPGRALRELQQAILQDDHRLSPSAALTA
ncbi:AfsR/SARP family transcriptional regulator [Streptomyces rubellomurinus]|uniref:OmpR/PhoB-type domain-containing protein n=1 Tax=Streptomyces rubellomurinus (strain ATCC 31215) TaxID=359131 RepID=A0A0F2TKI1_STRR3|nr:AfsR/SARP family transcriptional regulator [Streptomyces rubellomurinus]KJS62232.1 hypothetical protein VM95_10330 [Streptomyces rubellomurinus]